MRRARLSWQPAASWRSLELREACLLGSGALVHASFNTRDCLTASALVFSPPSVVRSSAIGRFTGARRSVQVGQP